MLSHLRAIGLTNFLANGGTLENAQAMADHASPCTQRYHRTGDEVTLDEVVDCDLRKEAHRWRPDGRRRARLKQPRR